MLIYTNKNIGICYLALGVPDKAEKNYLKALDTMTILQSGQEIDEELLKEDRE